ncbi:hypothetical protein K8Q93_00900 [Candidatus Parcubacteria bacterium]|nr:hypothetical protein [Candidatus Parcubacteria bacterium]
MTPFDEYIRSRAALEEFLESEGKKTFALQDPYILETRARALEAIARVADSESLGNLYRILTVVTDNLLAELRVLKENRPKGPVV